MEHATDFGLVVDAYLEAFNEMDLDVVMQYFATDVLYQPGDGSEFRGIEAVRKVFLPQFSYVWGRMTFAEENRIVDASKHTVVLTWTCHISAGSAKPRSLGRFLVLMLGRLRFGEQASWKGLDILHFNEAGQIDCKLTYANYSLLHLFGSRSEAN